MEEITEIIGEFMRKLDPEAVVGELRQSAEEKIINIRIKDAAHLIGKEGKTLQAINYLIKLILKKKIGLEDKIIIDIEGYHERKVAGIKNRAFEAAEIAKRSGKTQEISLLSAYERRLIHLALENENGVRTKSVGSGVERRIMIIPEN